MTSKLSKYLDVFRCLGLSWLAYRTYHAFCVRSGSFRRRLPCVPWTNTSRLSFVDHSFFSRPSSCSDGAMRDAADTLRGNHRYFSHHRFRGTFPPDWFASPFRPSQGQPDLRHWSELSDFGSGDIKGVWEQSRFAFVYSFARAYVSSHDECYAEAFWRAVEDWRDRNPPQCGPNWKCGQEIALRLVAWVFGYHAFLHAGCTTRQRRALLAEMVDVSARRIEVNIGYALSQKNNHGISEATGLFTAGIVLGKPRWIQRGRKLLRQQAQRLIYDDGSFSQHSTNYHRVMLHDYLWAIQLGRLNGIELGSRFLDRVRRAGQWLLTLLDERTGRVPNLGANDGALVLPLSDCDYLDFRPTVQAVGAIIDGKAWLTPGPWDELATWLGAKWSTPKPGGQSDEGSAATAVRSVSEGAVMETDPAHASGSFSPTHRLTGVERCCYFPDGGYAVLRDGETMSLFRCPQRFRHRPVHCDLLHFDLWHRGTNVLRDSGTYSYNCEQPWQDHFSSNTAHNTVQFDDHDQMPRLSRFLFGRWPTVTVENYLKRDPRSIAAGFTDWKGCRHHRKVALTSMGYRITDRLFGYRERAVLRWRLAPEWKWELCEDECRSRECTIRVTARPGPVVLELTIGWESLYYFERTELPVMQAGVPVGTQELTTEITLPKR